MRKLVIPSLLLVSALLILLHTETMWGHVPLTVQMQPLQLRQRLSTFQVAEGILTKVDPTASSVSIRTAEGRQMLFLYNRQTQIKNASAEFGCFAPAAENRIIVHYESVAGILTAMEIHVLPPL